MEARIPIHILNTFKPTSPGTVVDPLRTPADSRASKGVVAVVSKKNITVLNLSSNRNLSSITFLAKVRKRGKRIYVTSNFKSVYHLCLFEFYVYGSESLSWHWRLTSRSSFRNSFRNILISFDYLHFLMHTVSLFLRYLNYLLSTW